MANQPHGVNQFQNYNQIPIPGQNQFQNPIQGQFLNQFQGQNLNPIVMQGQFLNPMADPFSPYYLHPGENPRISLVSIQNLLEIGKSQVFINRLYKFYSQLTLTNYLQSLLTENRKCVN